MSWTAFLGALLLSACSSANPNSAEALKIRQQAIQDCILSGGHAHLGPKHSVLCEGGSR